MFGRNRQVNLFRELRIDNYLIEKEREIKNKIGRFSESALASMDVDSEVKKLINNASLDLPKLKKEDTKSNITTEEMTGQQLPSGTRFVMGRVYEIDIANYKVPFSGNKDFFKCHPSKNISLRPLGIELQNDSIIIKLTNWLGGISGNDEAIERLKNELISIIDNIETILTQLQNDIDEYIPILEKRIESELTALIKKVNIKNESNDKLNPFG